jgi:rhamnulokinase
MAGPVEATAIGNVMMQAIASGDVGSIEQARQIIAASFPLDRYDPRDPEPWDAAYPQYEQLLTRP